MDIRDIKARFDKMINKGTDRKKPVLRLRSARSYFMISDARQSGTWYALEFQRELQ
jgi:hypothetical protein